MLAAPTRAGGGDGTMHTLALRPIAEQPRRAMAPTTEARLSDARDTARQMDRFLASVERRGFRLALAQLGDRDDALDAVQDAMFTLVRKYATRAESEWTPLFWTILRSRVTDTQRRRAFRNRFRAWFGAGFGGGHDDDAGDPLEAIAGAEAEPSVVLEQRGALVAVEAAVRALPDRQQQAFMLRVYEGLDVAEAARAMGCSEGSVKTHLSRAMHALRSVLEEHV
jgi:RNA polymerase sigma-70 factor (ECF subfamily)